MIQNQIEHVDKDDNPANLPEARNIENFRAIFKGKVYAGGREAKTLHQLRLRIQKCLKEADRSTIQNLFESLRKKLDFIRRSDIIEKRK